MRLLFCALLLLPASLSAAEPLVLDLWPDAVPGQEANVPKENVIENDARIGLKVNRVNRPMLTVYQPPAEKRTGTAVVINPGGGYNILALTLEGVEVAEWFNSIGVTAIVLQYRVPRAPAPLTKHELPLKDCQRAISLVRQHAKEWNIEPNRIGLMGFSAGGHLAATTATNSDKRSYKSVDEADQQSCRPDFLMLIYPAYLVEKESVELTPEIKVDQNTPPTFLVHTEDDGVTALSSIAFFMALKKLKIPAELHIFQDGGHGYGLRPTKFPVTHWPARAEGWLKYNGWLDPAN